jgi:hypothetical protein
VRALDQIETLHLSTKFAHDKIKQKSSKYFRMYHVRNMAKIIRLTPAAIHRQTCIQTFTPLISLTSRMQILFATSVMCFLVLLWAGVAIARHIRKGPRRANTSTAGDSLSSSAPETIHQTIRQITASKVWNTPSVAVEIPPAHAANSVLRKPPYSVNAERLDWAYFNKDYGDLTDPYEHPTPRFRTNIATRR